MMHRSAPYYANDHELNPSIHLCLILEAVCSLSHFENSHLPIHLQVRFSSGGSGSSRGFLFVILRDVVKFNMRRFCEWGTGNSLELKFNTCIFSTLLKVLIAALLEK